MSFIQINLNHCEVAHSLLEQVLRKKGADIALISEPYKKGEMQNYILDSSKAAAICAPGRQPESLLTGEGFIRAKVGEFWLYSCYHIPSPNTAAVHPHPRRHSPGREAQIPGGDRR
ncbi:hypothetical protein KR026_009281 [Drosophila bipectinata]|nr:hypothetical protein KR026_009281 [Drosophila bipectinata]